MDDIGVLVPTITPEPTVIPRSPAQTAYGDAWAKSYGGLLPSFSDLGKAQTGYYTSALAKPDFGFASLEPVQGFRRQALSDIQEQADQWGARYGMGIGSNAPQARALTEKRKALQGWADTDVDRFLRYQQDTLHGGQVAGSVWTPPRPDDRPTVAPPGTPINTESPLEALLKPVLTAGGVALGGTAMDWLTKQIGLKPGTAPTPPTEDLSLPGPAGENLHPPTGKDIGVPPLPPISNPFSGLTPATPGLAPTELAQLNTPASTLVPTPTLGQSLTPPSPFNLTSPEAPPTLPTQPFSLTDTGAPPSVTTDLPIGGGSEDLAGAGADALTTTGFDGLSPVASGATDAALAADVAGAAAPAGFAGLSAGAQGLADATAAFEASALGPAAAAAAPLAAFAPLATLPAVGFLMHELNRRDTEQRKADSIFNSVTDQTGGNLDTAAAALYNLWYNSAGYNGVSEYNLARKFDDSGRPDLGNRLRYAMTNKPPAIMAAQQDELARQAAGEAEAERFGGRGN